MRRPSAYFQRVGWDAGKRRPSIASARQQASRGLPARIWQEMANFTSKSGFWEASRELPARIWQEIANFTFKSGLWEASRELPAGIWQEIAHFYF